MASALPAGVGSPMARWSNGPGTLPGLAFVLALIACAFATTAHARYASVVMDAESGTVLYARNADTRNYPASLTKIMTLYLLFEALERGQLTLDQKLTVSRRAAGQAPSRIGLRRGQKMRVREVILALAVKSANDAAVVAAEALAKSEVTFARLMTKRARELGMKGTTFRNASGLPNRGQKSTARDMAILARALLRNFPQYYDNFSTRKFRYKNRTYRNHNRLLTQYSGTDGIKTGYIHASGYNVVASVERNGRRLIGVVFGGRTARTRDRHMVALFDKGFARLRRTVALEARPLRKPALPGGPAVREIARTETGPTPKRPPPRPPNPYDRAVALPPPAAQPARHEAATPGWAIQVGAFGGVARARRAALVAASRANYQLTDASIQITPVAFGGDTLYRARLLGLSEPRAKTACLTLRQLTFDCIVVAPGGADDFMALP